MRKELNKIFIPKIVFILFLTTVIITVFPSKLSNLSFKENEETVEDKEEIELKEPEEEKPEKTPLQPETPSSTDWWKYPNIIYETERNGNDLLVLVNKQYKLPSTYAPSDLVLASNADIRRGEKYYLRDIVISDLRDMVNTARENGIDLSIVSGYRSYQTQVDTYNYWLKKNNNNVEYVDTFSARPGHSQHQLGTVIDFSTNEINDELGDSFANTKASEWLVENAYKYGWVISYPKGYENITGYKYESWHYRYIGKDNATEMINRGMILENYLESEN